MITAFVVVVHIIATFLLVVLVLLHSGKGGGLSDMFGGVGASAAGSTVVEKNLDKITLVVAVTFVFTTVGLGLLLE